MNLIVSIPSDYSKQDITLKAADNHAVTVKCQRPEGVVKGVVFVSHGMSEHSARYDFLAKTLCKHHYAVFSHDHRGHGKAVNQGLAGHFSDRRGWDKVVADLESVYKHILSKFPAETPIYLFAHSMGSFAALHFLMKRQPKLSGVILSGSTYQLPLASGAARIIARLERLRQGRRGKSDLIDFLSFGNFNSQFGPNRTQYDWLSSCEQNVDAYLSDPLCGFKCTNQFWVDFLAGLKYIFKSANTRRIPNNLPIFVLSGDKDPVGKQGKGVKKLVKHLRRAGLSVIDYKLYAEGRHEMLHETNRSEVLSDILNWLKKTSPTPTAQIMSQ